MTLLRGIVLAMSAVSVASAAGIDERPLLIRGISLIDGTGAPKASDASVVVRNGLIEVVGRSDRVILAEDAEVIDGTGKVLIPGLWDMHVHLTDLTDVSLAAFVANGVTGVRDMGGDLALIDGWRAEIANGDRIGPRIVRPGPFVDGYKEGIPYRRVVATAEDGRAAVRDLVSQRVDFIKIHNAVPRDAYFALAEEAHSQGVRFSGHIPVTVTPTEAVAAGQNSIEHTETLIEGTLPTTFREDGLGLPDGLEKYVTEGSPELFRLMARKGTAYCPMLIAYYESARRNEVEANPDPRAQYVAASLQKQWLEYFPTRPPVVEKIRMRIFGSFEKLVAEMQKAGVLILAGSDTAARNTYPGFSLHDELALLVESGLSPMEAIQAATINAARHLELDDVTGTVEVGKWADLVLLDADPLSDIGNTKSISGVVTGGRYLTRDELDAMLAEVTAKAPSR